MVKNSIFFKIIKSGNVADLKLTAYDDQIYEKFRTDFGDFNVQLVDEDVLKSDLGKEKWRSFCEHFRHIEDYNEGTLLRSDAKCTENGPDSCILVLRIQFLAIEIARNREGFNVFS